MKNQREQKRESGQKGFSTKDIMVIVLCIAALAVLGIILLQTRKANRQAQEKLSEINEQLQQEESGTANGGTYSALVINEVNQEGWIELYNSGKDSLDLSVLTILVDGKLLATGEEDWKLEPESLLVVELDKALKAGVQHLLTIQGAEGDVAKALIIPSLEKKESYGCVSDGSVAFSVQSASKGVPNTEGNTSKNDEMAFSVPAGFYSDEVQLEISVPEGTEVYYTLDGTKPTKKSERYKDAITIENRSGSNYTYAANELDGYVPSSVYMGTVVRAVAVDSKGKVTQELTASYYIEIGSNSDLADIPVISITADPDDLFDYFKGIYVKGRLYEDVVASGVGDVGGNYYEDWTRTAHIEYFEKNKEKTYEGDVQLSVLKDYSLTTPQKGLYVEGADEGAWDGSSLQQFFNEESTSFSIQANKRDNSSKAREYLANNLLESTAVGTAKLMPCVVFVDGEYWGLYTLRQPCDSQYFEEYYGIVDEEVIVAKDGKISDPEYKSEYSDFVNYVVSHDMSKKSEYNKVKEMMDMQSYVDYFCANMYLANVEYGMEEAYAWKTVSKGEGTYADGKWRWIIGKLDCSMNTAEAKGAATSSIDTFLQQGVQDDELFRALLKSEEFKELLKSAMKNMQENVFAPDKVENELEQISQHIGKAATSSYERFFAYPDSDFYSNQTKEILEFFDERGEYILIYTDELDTLDKRLGSYQKVRDQEGK